MWFGCFDVNGFKSAEMTTSTATAKDGKFAIIVLMCTCPVCKRCCPIAEKEVSDLRLLIGLQERANVFRS